jgi:hypothetical protein
MNQLVPITSSSVLPALVTAAGESAQVRFLEFFAASIRNSHTRRAYAGAVGELSPTGPRPLCAASPRPSPLRRARRWRTKRVSKAACKNRLPYATIMKEVYERLTASACKDEAVSCKNERL